MKKNKLKASPPLTGPCATLFAPVSSAKACVTKSFLCFALLVTGFNLKAQKNNNVWAFGYGQKIDFNQTPPDFKTSNCNGNEGFASVCDDNGKLLFYSDGNTVWSGLKKDNNTNDAVLKNGSSLLGNTEQSSNQGVGIARVPNSTHLYYLFVLEAKEQYSLPDNKSYLRYNVIDMNADGGIGEVIKKNIILDSFMSESMAFIPFKNNCSEYWLITHSNNDSTKAYAAFKIDDNGIQAPVYSPGKYSDALKFAVSHDFKKIVTSYYNEYFASDTLSFIPRPLEIGTFDNGTGMISNPMLFSAGPDSGIKIAVIFSPDDSKLYFTNTLNLTQSIMGQIDMNAYPDPTAMENSMTMLTQTLDGDTTSVDYHMNNDGEIIILNTPYLLSCIHNPNASGNACNYERNYINPPPTYLNGSFNPVVNAGASFPLPAFVPLRYHSNSGDTAICKSDNNQITLTISTNAPEVIEWNTGAVDSSITVSTDGQYIATANTFVCGTLSDTINVHFLDVCLCTPFVPSAFSPNGDGLNDILSVKVSCRVYNFFLNIYNRYGQRVFHGSSIYQNWDGSFGGKIMDTGTYFYYLSYKNESGKMFSKRGDITLIR